MGVWAWVALAATLLATAGYALLVWRYGYWRRRGVPAHRPLPLVGSFLDAVLFRKTVGEVYRDIYRQFSGQPACGYFKCLQPALLLRDPELVGTVLVKDFSSFKDNDIYMPSDIDPMFGRSPFSEKGDKWKLVRGQLTSTFTPARMRGLKEQLIQTTEEISDYLKNESNREAGIDVKKMAAMAATDAVALCMLGVRGNALRDKASEFGGMCRFLLDAGLWDSINIIIFLLLPSLSHVLRIRFVPESVAQFFRKVVREATEVRQKSGLNNPDYLQLSIAVREKYPEFTEEDAAAHACMFFMDGFEPTSTTLALALYHVALDGAVQTRAAAEVDAVLAQHEGRLDYDAAQDLKYLDMIVCETLRMYPPLRSLDRVCTQRYELSLGAGSVQLEPGTPVVVPVHALHHDARFYPQPERWQPERFDEEQRAARPKYTFLPFGEGPRICVGQRYATTVIKLALATVLRDYRLEPRPDTPRAVSHDLNSAFYLAPRETLRLRFLERE
ncbi:hypothetical protein R5R35_002296 [Gryllus longicercus]|uniref:Cytochrome P450 n=1 Tax=Gryllus longicercus TaxID=2509291 RepID=A0AAN9VZX6_9ORTH